MSIDSDPDPGRSCSRFSQLLDAAVRISERGRYAPSIILACFLGPASLACAVAGHPVSAVLLAGNCAVALRGTMKAAGSRRGAAVPKLPGGKDEEDTA